MKIKNLFQGHQPRPKKKTNLNDVQKSAQHSHLDAEPFAQVFIAAGDVHAEVERIEYLDGHRHH
jgi:hypothetical protein